MKQIEEIKKIREKYRDLHIVVYDEYSIDCAEVQKIIDIQQDKKEEAYVKYQNDHMLLVQAMKQCENVFEGNVDKNKVDFLQYKLLQDLESILAESYRKYKKNTNEIIKELKEEQVEIRIRTDLKTNKFSIQEKRELDKVYKDLEKAIKENFEFLNYEKIVNMCSALQSIDNCTFKTARYKESYDPIMKSKYFDIVHFIPAYYPEDAYVLIRLHEKELVHIYKNAKCIIEYDEELDIEFLNTLNNFFKYCNNCLHKNKDVAKTTVSKYVNQLHKLI